MTIDAHWEKRPPTRALQAPQSWTFLSSCLRCHPSSLHLCRGARHFSGGLAFFFPVVSRPGHWLSESASNLCPASLEEFIFCWLLLVPFSEFSGVDNLKPENQTNPCKAGADECPDFFLAVTVFFFPHPSAPQSRAGFTVVLMILVLMLMVRLDDAQVFFM